MYLSTSANCGIATTANVQKVVRQIGIEENNRDYLRFRCLKKTPNAEEEMLKIKQVPITRKPFGTAANLFMLKATPLHHFPQI